MIFIGYNSRISFPRYNHHSRWTDSRCLPNFICRWWNRLKAKNPAWQILEWSYHYGKPYCRDCMDEFIETGDTFIYFNGIPRPDRNTRIKIVEELKLRERFL